MRLVSSGSAEAYVGWSKNINNYLMASFIKNICTQNYSNLIIQVVIDKFWCVFMPHIAYTRNTEGRQSYNDCTNY